MVDSAKNGKHGSMESYKSFGYQMRNTPDIKSRLTSNLAKNSKFGVRGETENAVQIIDSRVGSR